MRYLTILLTLLCIQGIRVQATQTCQPASGEPLLFGAVFPQDFLLMDASNSAYAAIQAMTSAINACRAGLPPIAWQLEVATTYDDALAAMQRFADANIPLVIGSGMDHLSDGLHDAAADHEIVFWDVTQLPRTEPSAWSFALRPDATTLGSQIVTYIQRQITPLHADEPLRLALVTSDQARLTTLADTVRQAIPPSSLVVDASFDENRYQTAVAIRETAANVVLALSLNDDAYALWSQMREADANVDAWLLFGQERLITPRYSNYLDVNGLLVIGSHHIAVETIDQAIPAPYYEAFVTAYQAQMNRPLDLDALNAAVGTYALLTALPDDASVPLTSTRLRAILQTMTDHQWHDLEDDMPLVVRQVQEDDYCLIAPRSLATCDDPLQPFPTWRDREWNAE